MRQPAPVIADGHGGFTMIGDADPIGDVCSNGSHSLQMGGKNIGDLLNAAGITWGFFKGGFDLTIANPDGTHGLQAQPHVAHHEREQGGLHPAPPAVPVLRLHRQPAAHPADVGRR